MLLPSCNFNLYKIYIYFYWFFFENFMYVYNIVWLYSFPTPPHNSLAPPTSNSLPQFSYLLKSNLLSSDTKTIVWWFVFQKHSSYFPIRSWQDGPMGKDTCLQLGKQSLIPETHMVGEEPMPESCPLTPPRMLIGVCAIPTYKTRWNENNHFPIGRTIFFFPHSFFISPIFKYTMS